jgi:hypothetical protein
MPDEIIERLQQLARAGKVRFRCDEAGRITQIDHDEGSRHRCVRRFDADVRLRVEVDRFSGVPERETIYTLDEQGRCVRVDEWRYDGAWEWNADVTFDATGAPEVRAGVESLICMDRAPRFEHTTLEAVVLRLLR